MADIKKPLNRDKDRENEEGDIRDNDSFIQQKPDRKDSKEWPCWKPCAWCQLVTAFVLLVVLLTVTIYWKVRREKALAPREQELCVPIGDLVIKQDEEQRYCKKRTQTQDNQTLCCGDTSDIFQQMVEKTARNEFKENYLTRMLAKEYQKCENDEEIHAARLAGISTMEMENDRKSNKTIHWNTTSTLSFVKPGITYSHGSFQVEKEGHYYVFSEVKLNETNDLYNGNEDKYRSHCMHKVSKETGLTIKLIESSKSGCKLYSKENLMTSSIGAIFKLRAGDKVFVEVSHPQFLIPCEHSNVFFMYKT